MKYKELEEIYKKIDDFSVVAFGQDNTVDDIKAKGYDITFGTFYGSVGFKTLDEEYTFIVSFEIDEHTRKINDIYKEIEFVDNFTKETKRVYFDNMLESIECDDDDEDNDED